MTRLLRTFSILMFLAFAPLAVGKALATPHGTAPPAAAAHDDHADAAHADDHGHGGHEPAGPIPSIKQAIAPAIATILVFLVVLFVLSTQVWPKIAKGLADREGKIRAEIKNAEDARRQAKDALDQYQQNLAEARAEANKMIEQARQQQAALSAELKAKADLELTGMREKAMRDIDAAKRAALAEIYAESSALATTLAGKILRREIGHGDNQRLVDESLAELGKRRN
jgi:F-type H+-transporting ATPase subunit b